MRAAHILVLLFVGVSFDFDQNFDARNRNPKELFTKPLRQLVDLSCRRIASIPSLILPFPSRSSSSLLFSSSPSPQVNALNHTMQHKPTISKLTLEKYIKEITGEVPKRMQT
jgi:hypothetical protein